ncbi:MAG: ectonucleotide pyrophosphatase/phosphodiesterase [Treponema sp.]|nr:ectonucleotide pyrophosphatase/phosphodiesterase [Treponema sp.]
MLIISYDAIGDSEFEKLSGYPVFASFLKQSAVFRDVSTVFLSNTYPVHTSVVTGALPEVHGVTSNTAAFPSADPLWNCNEEIIKAKTIWQLASEKGLKTAAVLWPVTAFSKTINYNVPEVRARPGKNQVLTSLKAGSAFLQLKLFLRHRALLNGIKQPNLDNFSAACMADILREKKPDICLVHLTAYDAICHDSGPRSEALETAYLAMDKNLEILLDAYSDGDIILFSDHSQVNVHTVLDPNAELVKAGLMNKNGGVYFPGESGCFFELCGGAAFFHAGKLNADQIGEVKLNTGRGEGFCRFLTPAEMRESGLGGAAFGFCAKEGFCYEFSGTEKKGNHGYPLDMSCYTVFYMVKGCGLESGKVTKGGSLLDIAPLVIRHLGL